jgi:hypothetical protein
LKAIPALAPFVLALNGLLGDPPLALMIAKMNLAAGSWGRTRLTFQTEQAANQFAGLTI